MVLAMADHETPDTRRGGGHDHVPVLAAEVASVFAATDGGTYVDLTVGLGGHAALLLDAHPGLRLVGIDRDRDALAIAAERLARFGSRVSLHHARSDGLPAVLDAAGADDVTAVLADLGVSSPQVDRPERGFSYRSDRDGPLDMRMDQTRGRTAADLLAEVDEDALVRALRDLADEPHARRVARALVEAEPRTTSELAEAVRGALPAARRRRGDPAKRVFQAVRILVNDEIGTLDRTLDLALDALVPGGRLAVISFHSVEDRMVKTRFRAAADGGCTCPEGLPCVCGAEPTHRLLRRKPWVADDAERAANPRASSARLRAVEALAPGETP
ncbi:16S rRNA (cytosine(1402)-N(4))-methyltransferase RsmH [Iamia majanohamensis]|uniref:Ribosomal RNA small subunit methyltransferase H n=1 Tax=Iamia majanohamensis TaxID=467976 RepID=A0AAF0BTU8_9ACTN|nr:16S rRNA (cytosine(1402)-N(4))-methyltransferase RsmH [Iamia majanohamensis]WCO65228.1 16S rRNA (cytosine(1402)-N(4))-methyltransferase RsmH [Iamia majanohamensis]